MLGLHRLPARLQRTVALPRQQLSVLQLLVVALGPLHGQVRFPLPEDGLQLPQLHRRHHRPECHGRLELRTLLRSRLMVPRRLSAVGRSLAHRAHLGRLRVGSRRASGHSERLRVDSKRASEHLGRLRVDSKRVSAHLERLRAGWNGIQRTWRDFECTWEDFEWTREDFECTRFDFDSNRLNSSALDSSFTPLD